MFASRGYRDTQCAVCTKASNGCYIDVVVSPCTVLCRATTAQQMRVRSQPFASIYDDLPPTPTTLNDPGITKTEKSSGLKPSRNKEDSPEPADIAAIFEVPSGRTSGDTDIDSPLTKSKSSDFSSSADGDASRRPADRTDAMTDKSEGYSISRLDPLEKDSAASRGEHARNTAATDDNDMFS